MPNYNQITLVGHLTRDPELTTVAGGTPLTKCGIAVNEKWKTKTGETKERVMFIDLAVWNKGGEVFAKYTAKGVPVMIIGKLQLEQWEKDGKRNSRHTVNVEQFVLLGKPVEKTAPPAYDAPPPSDPTTEYTPF